MKNLRIRHKLLLILATALCLGFAAMIWFYNKAVEESILGEYQRTLHRLSESVILSIETIMIEDHAEIMHGYAKRLKSIPGVIDFRIARIDGTEAYLDNRTIRAVNDRLGETAFEPRPKDMTSDPVFLPNDPEITKLFEGTETTYRIQDKPGQGPLMYFFDTIPNSKACKRCHGKDQRIRGIVRIVSSMEQMELDLAVARMRSLVILGLSLLATILITSVMLRRMVADPLEKVNRAITAITSGNYDTDVGLLHNKNEIGAMADSFNIMRTSLRDTHKTMHMEQEKLKTLIQGAQEAVVVTDSAGSVVLVNAAACELLNKPEQQIRTEGIVNLVDKPEIFRPMLESLATTSEPIRIAYRDRWLLCAASTIRDDKGQPIGSAALLRDVTEEQKLLLELERLSTTDALTDVYNRRHLDFTLKTELERARNSQLPLSLIMFDVDHFKKFNDTYGHDQGDRVLQAMGTVMKASVREYDVPCRYGGEEFVIVLPATSTEGALAVSERLRRNVESTEVDELRVTISLGIACYPDIAVDSAETLIQAADAALYLSKEGGRNRSTVAKKPA